MQDRGRIVFLSVIASAGLALAGAPAASAAITTSYDPSFAFLAVTGDAADDSVTVTCASGFLYVNGLPISPVGSQNYVPCSQVRSIYITTAGGNDGIDTTGVSPAAGFTGLPERGAGGDPVYVDSGPGDDSFSDGPADSGYNGSAGSDVAFAGAGDDVFSGNQESLADAPGDPTGNDRLYGQDGDDFLHGGVRADKLFGGAGKDALDGHEGNDTIKGEGGKDELRGDSGSDQIFGGSGGDEMFGGDKDDDLRGNGGRDEADGESGTDRCRAERVRGCER